MELELKDYTYKEKKISFTIKEKEINGLYCNHTEDIVNILSLNNPNRKNILINNKKLEESDWHQVEEKIVIVPEWIEDNIHELTLENIMIEYIKQREIYPKNLKKKLKDSLKIVGLPESLLERNIYSLSTAEQKLFQIAESLLSNPDMIILVEPLKVLDLKNQKKIMMILKRIKDHYQKAIVIVSNDTETLYRETEHCIIMKNDKVLIEDKTIDVFKQIDFLKKHKVEIPEIIEFTFLANKKAKIDYYRDVRDLIKDIYKHV